SEVTFKVKHMMISSVTGYLKDFDVEVDSQGEEFENAAVKIEANMKSLTTGNAQRATHLRPADSGDVDKNAVLVSKSTRYSRDGDDITLEGDLTIRGVTKPIVLDVEFGGIQKEPWGNTRAGFTVTGKLSRKDFGLNWNTALESGGVLVGDEVKIN